MTRGKLIGIVLAVAAALAVLLLWPKAPVSDKELIEQKVIQMAAAAEKKDVGFIMEQISERFAGTGPSINKGELHRLILGQTLRGQWVRVFIREQEATVTSATEATWRGKFVFGRSEADTLEKLAAESNIGGYELEGTLEKESDGEWRFVTGSYKQIPPGQIF